MKYRFGMILIPLSLLAITQCGAQRIESSWRNAEISIDGNPGEWKNSLQYPENNKFGIGFMNDEKDLYICMTSWAAETNKLIMQQGFTLFFKTPSGKGRIFGIHFPCAMERFPMGGPGPHNQNQSFQEHGSGNMNGNMDMKDSQPGQQQAEMRENADKKFENSIQNIQIIGPGESDTVPMKMIQAETAGLVARVISLPNGNLCYEAKIPLRYDPSVKFAIGAEKDSVIKMSFETSVPSAGTTAGGPPSGGSGSGMGGPPGGGMGGMGGPPQGHGGGGGMGGGPGGGPGGGGNGQQSTSTDQFTGSFLIKLAVKP
jgi:hypothetical protein